MNPATITPAADALFESAMKLSATEREALGHRLLDSVAPPTDADWEYWKAEIKRRVEDVESGRVKPLTLEEAMASIRKAREERS